MKLIFCPYCQDVVALRMEPRTCACGKCSGQYLEDCYHAVINEEAVPVGFLNSEFVDALYFRPEEGMGSRFTAFVIPKKCDTIEVKE